MMIYRCDLGIWPPFFSTVHLLPLFRHQRSFSYSLSFDLTYNHQITFRRDVTEGVRAVRVAQITGDGKEKKREPPSWIFFLHDDFSHCRLTRRARKTGPIADRLRTVSRGQHSRTQRRESLISFSSPLFLSLSLPPGTHALCFFSHTYTRGRRSRVIATSSAGHPLEIWWSCWIVCWRLCRAPKIGAVNAEKRRSAEDPSIVEDLCQWIIDIGNDTIQLLRRRARNYIPRAHQECSGEVQCVKTNQTHSAHRRQSDAKLSCIGLLMIISKEPMTSTWDSIVGFNKVRRLFLEN